jgi:hypothetical protein
MSLTPEQRVLRSRIGGLAKSAKFDPREATEPARVGWRAKWLREADPDGVLPDAERERRADALMRAHMSRLALSRSTKAAKQRQSV